MSLARPLRRPPMRDALDELLRSTRFRLGPRTARVAANLNAYGGTVDPGSSVWIGADLPPLGAPSVSLGTARGTLGPHSYGFFDAHRGVAPFAAPLPARPRPGPVALVCPRRDALVDVGPLVVARLLGVSWIISVGDGDPEDVLAFLAADEATGAVLFAPGAGARPEVVRVLGDKPVAVLGGEPLLRAAARRMGGMATDDLEAWLAFGALAEAEVGKPRAPLAIVAGGGAALIAQMARAAGLDLHVATVDDDEEEVLEQAVAEAAAGADLLLLAGIPRPTAGSVPILEIDPTSPARASALLAALAARLAPPPVPIPRVRADRVRAQAILDEIGENLGDHDAKRVLHIYGVRVSRQAPASSPTAALRVAQQLGWPVDVLIAPDPAAASSRSAGVRAAAVRRAANTADLKRAAGVLLEQATFVLVREAFPARPRAVLAVRHEGKLGPVARIHDERALLPLDRADAIHLARSAAGDVARPLVDLLARSTACAAELGLDLELELHCGDEPAVVAASARWRRGRGVVDAEPPVGDPIESGSPKRRREDA